MTKVRILIPGVVVLVLAAVALFLHSGSDSPTAVAGAGTPTATVPVHTVQLSKVDADSDAPLAGWELIAYRGPDCQDHPVNDIFTQTQPVQMQLQAGMYSFLETMQAGWVNVTPLCQPVDLTSGDGELVFENRHQGTPAPLPDLVVDSIADAQQPFDCVHPAGVKVTVRNAGQADAAASVTRVSVTSSSPQLIATAKIPAGGSVTIYSNVTGIPLNDTYTAEADYQHDVAESDEINNTFTTSLSLGTLPTCTPTNGSPTPVGTPTATPTMHTVTLSKENADSGELLAGWELIAYHGPSCQGHPINDIFTATTPVTMDLVAGVYSFLETLHPGWVNLTPTCQAVDLTAGDGELVFRNRLLSPLGDTDCDGMVTSVDAALVLQLDARLIDAVSCPFQADANHDGLLNSIDALLILQDVAGLIDLGTL